jgi:hypothetical protein
VLPELTPDKLRSIVIKDNVAFGSDDFDMLANDWDIVELVEWGMEIPSLNIENELELDDILGEESNKPAVIKITFKDVEQLQQAENDIKELIDRKYKGAFCSVSAGEI